MPTDDPKPLLALAEKQIASAKDALAETDRIRRLQSQLEKEHKTLIDSADPEDRPQMKQLGEINAQLQVIPHRIEKCGEKQIAAGVALAGTGVKLAQVINELAEEEREKYIAEIEAKLLPYCPDSRDARNGELRNRARGLAGKCSILEHICDRANGPRGTQGLGVVEDLSALNNEPAKALPEIIDFAQDRLVILSQWFADRKTFVAREWWEAGK